MGEFNTEERVLDGTTVHPQGVALILEGGGFRGMYSAGVMDVLLERGISDFASVWGVSAGAINAVSFKSRQVGRSMRVMMAFRDDRRFMSLWSWATTGNMAGGDFMYDEIQNHLDPCDNEAFNSNPMRMFAVASDVVFGTPAYLECKSFPEDVKKVRASASMPLVSQMVDIDGHRYLDGGTTDSVPYAVALGLGSSAPPVGYVPARRALVVLTQDRGYVKGEERRPWSYARAAMEVTPTTLRLWTLVRDATTRCVNVSSPLSVSHTAPSSSLPPRGPSRSRRTSPMGLSCSIFTCRVASRLSGVLPRSRTL